MAKFPAEVAISKAQFFTDLPEIDARIVGIFANILVCAHGKHLLSLDFLAYMFYTITIIAYNKRNVNNQRNYRIIDNIISDWSV